MKKQYTKPSMEIYDLKHRQMILCSSEPTRGYDYEFGYIPNDTTLSSRT